MFKCGTHADHDNLIADHGADDDGDADDDGNAHL